MDYQVPLIEQTSMQLYPHVTLLMPILYNPAYSS